MHGTTQVYFCVILVCVWGGIGYLSFPETEHLLGGIWSSPLVPWPLKAVYLGNGVCRFGSGVCECLHMSGGQLECNQVQGP